MPKFEMQTFFCGTDRAPHEIARLLSKNASQIQLYLNNQRLFTPGGSWVGDIKSPTEFTLYSKYSAVVAQAKTFATKR